MRNTKPVRREPLNPRSLEAIARRLLDTRLALTGGATSQSAYAEAAGIARNTYNQWEKGASRPELDKAVLLCDHYRLSLDWIYLGRRDGLPFQVASQIPSSAE